MSSEDEPAVQRTTVAGHQQLPLLPPPPPRPAESSSTPSTASMSAPASKEASASSDGVATPSTSDGIRSAIFNTQKLNEEPKPIEFATPSAPASNGSHKPRPSRWTKARSTSTESFVSSMGIPATLGSQYNQEGFPNYPISSDDEEGDARIVADDDAIAKQLAQTDEAVRQINGTASVVQARNIGNMMPSAQSTNQYELPRSMAAYVQRQPRGDHRGERGELKTGGSFVSSGSSTSSEESEYFGSVQWVQSVAQPTNTNMSNYPFYYTNPSGGAANPKMPPPATIGNRKLNSPRRGSNGGLPSSGPATPNASAPKGLPANNAPLADSSAVDTPTENDDDDQTVGGPNREGSPSSSSASGLDLLIHAAEHHERNRYSTYIKRKKGAEAVAQWRQSGIPTGPSRADRPPAFDNSPGYESTPSDGQAQDNGSAEPPKKRRRSEMKLEAPDSSLRKPASEPSEAESDIESQGSASDSEYQGGKRGRRNSNKGKQKSRVRATLPIPQSGASAASASPAKESPTPKKAAPKARRPSNTSDTKPGALPAGGVQCEYVNPLPPYQRCPDVFTRKYDIPRHMARHARREGDLVAEGKLPEEKAMLWKTIRDKPRIRCKVCLEYFTRQDALKRHQNKQHHH